MYRRKRRNQGTWLPVLGTEYGTDLDPHEHISFFNFRLDVPANGPADSVIGIFPVTYDTPQEDDDITNKHTPLIEVVGNEYFLKRIVGKCFLNVAEEIDTDANAVHMPRGYIVTAGMFIARAQDTKDVGGQDVPLGGIIVNNYGPQMRSTIREPWIWRRSWNLGGTTQIVGLDAAGSLKQYGWFPPNNAEYGSIQDGPHIDQKTKRRVRQDERLWFVCQARSTTSFVSAGVNAIAEIEVWCDFRYFAASRKAKNQGNF